MTKFNFKNIEGAAVCTRNLKGEVTSQNAASVKICGDNMGKMCSAGCLDFPRFRDVLPSSPDRLSTINRCVVRGVLVDALLIKENDELTTVLFPRDESTATLAEIDPGNVLTRREREISEMIQKGYTNSEIQKKFTISKSTLKTHINHIYKKLAYSPLEGRARLRMSAVQAAPPTSEAPRGSEGSQAPNGLEGLEGAGSRPPEGLLLGGP